MSRADRLIQLMLPLAMVRWSGRTSSNDKIVASAISDTIWRAAQDRYRKRFERERAKIPNYRIHYWQA